MHISVYIHTYACMYIYICVCVCVCVCLCVYIYINTYTYIYTCICICIIHHCIYFIRHSHIFSCPATNVVFPSQKAGPRRNPAMKPVYFHSSPSRPSRETGHTLKNASRCRSPQNPTPSTLFETLLALPGQLGSERVRPC